MTESELREARQHMKLQEALKNPAVRQAYEYAQRRANEEKRRQEILERWGSNGYVPPTQAAEPKPLTDAEMRQQEILKYYS